MGKRPTKGVIKLAGTMGDWSLKIPLVKPGKPWCKSTRQNYPVFPRSTQRRELGRLFTNFALSGIEVGSHELCWAHRVVSAAWEEALGQRELQTMTTGGQPVCPDVVRPEWEGWVNGICNVPLKQNRTKYPLLPECPPYH